MLFTMFGQFIDHDTSQTNDQKNPDASEMMNIDIPDDDERISELADGFQIPFIRSENHINCDDNRVPINNETPFLDLSTIYGFD